MPSHRISKTQDPQNELLKIELELLLNGFTNEIKSVITKLDNRITRLEKRLERY